MLIPLLKERRNHLHTVHIQEGRLLPILNKKSFKYLSKYTGAEINILKESNKNLTKTTVISVDGNFQQKNKFFKMLKHLEAVVQYKIVKD